MLVELFQNSMNMLFDVVAAAWYTIPLIVILWSVTLFAEKKKLPRSKQDFIELRYDLTEFALMNALVMVVFVAQVALVNIVLSLLGVRVYQRTCWSRL